MRCGATVPWVALAVAVAAPRAGGSAVNVVHYLVDDLSPDLVGVHRDAAGARGSGYGSGWETPRLAAMAKAGVAFRTAWAPAMCTPSRVSLLTGRYPSETGVLHNNLILGGRGCVDAAPWPLLLQQAGYATAVAGKWGVKGTLRALETPARAGFGASHVWMQHVRTAKFAASPCVVTEGRDVESLGEVPSRTWGACFGNETAFVVEDFGPAGEWAFVERFMAAAPRPFAVYWPTVLAHETAGRTMPATPRSVGGRVDLGDRAAVFCRRALGAFATSGDLSLNPIKA